MAVSDQEQKSINVPMHKRLAMGEKLDGTSLQAKGVQTSKPKGGLSNVKKQK